MNAEIITFEARDITDPEVRSAYTEGAFQGDQGRQAEVDALIKCHNAIIATYPDLHARLPSNRRFAVLERAGGVISVVLISSGFETVPLTEFRALQNKTCKEVTSIQLTNENQ